MSPGALVEIGPTQNICGEPRRPYTRALLSAAPVAQWGVERKRLRLKGEISSPIDPPDACRLVGRCLLAQPACAAAKPALIDIGHDHAVACPVVIGGEAPSPSGDLHPRLAAPAPRRP